MILHYGLAIIQLVKNLLVVLFSVAAGINTTTTNISNVT